MKYYRVIIVSTLFLLLTACHSTHRHDHGYHHQHDHGYRNGPPPHAPAHGYRHKHHGHDLVYDSRLGVYIVVGIPEHYYFDGHYYRYNQDHWYISKDLDRGWKSYREKDLPRKFAEGHKSRTKSHKGQNDNRKSDDDYPGKGKGKNNDKSYRRG